MSCNNSGTYKLSEGFIAKNFLQDVRENDDIKAPTISVYFRNRFMIKVLKGYVNSERVYWFRWQNLPVIHTPQITEIARIERYRQIGRESYRERVCQYV